VIVESRVEPIALPQQLHLGVVVKDMDKTIERLSSTFGIGPWDIKERRYPEAQVVVGKGPFAYRVAFADLGPIELELIEVLEGSTIHADFLNTKGEGLHHIGFRIADMQQAVDTLQQQGIDILQSAFREGSRYVYMDPAECGGIMFEFIQRSAE
jgi:methylmalonyl-CoA/ethylmalonyl-CoA epimerase